MTKGGEFPRPQPLKTNYHTNEDAQARFGANVNDLRQRRRLPIEALAERSGLDQDELAAILAEKPSHRPDRYLLPAPGGHTGDLFQGMSWIPPADGGSGYVIDDLKDLLTMGLSSKRWRRALSSRKSKEPPVIGEEVHGPRRKPPRVRSRSRRRIEPGVARGVRPPSSTRLTSLR